MSKPVSTKNKPEGLKDEALLVKGASTDGESVDRIRDILFGAQVRQYDQRFRGLEDMIKSEAAKSREDARKANESLEQYVKKALESLIVQLKAEQKERADGDGELAKKLEGLGKALTQEIQRSQAELTAALRKAVQELRKDKADRLALGNLFNEIGLRLKEEFKLPEAK